MEKPSPSKKVHDHHHDNKNDQDDDTLLSNPAEAGLLRGISQSIRSTIFRGSVGRLPRSAAATKSATTTLRVPIRQVARISDRMSTGFDLWDSASEVAETNATVKTTTKKQPSRIQHFVRLYKAPLQSFVVSLVKNTALGAAVFETYGYLVQDDHDTKLSNHFWAGAGAGCTHAILGTFWDVVAGSNYSSLQSFPRVVLWHSTTHASLFGCYQAIKGPMVSLVEDDKEKVIMDERTRQSVLFQKMEYLVAVGMAGGMAGQIQHVLSFGLEQWFKLTPSAVTVKTFLPLSQIHPPPLRGILWAFPPSAIAFIALEYGRLEDDDPK